MTSDSEELPVRCFSMPCLKIVADIADMKTDAARMPTTTRMPEAELMVEATSTKHDCVR